MRFWDEVHVVVQGGKGGNGCVGFRREALTPKGGPDGGNGGNGGAVVLVADPGLTTLSDFAQCRLLVAKNGLPGEGNQKTGADGENAIYRVPVGCQVYFRGSLAADLAVPGARWVAARGGHGGKGNTFFKSSTRQAPDFAQDGQVGETFEFDLVLKCVADVGLVGLPNVGKSTLIAAITEAKPKIASYPFTTLIPQLGVTNRDGEEDKKFVIADIPGLIPGAHVGKGLGIQFLKHVERTRILVQLLDATIATDGLTAPTDLDDEMAIREAVIGQFRMIDHELRMFSAKLGEMRRIIAFSKCDIPICQRTFEICRGEFPFPTLAISSADGTGLVELMDTLDKQFEATQTEV